MLILGSDNCTEGDIRLRFGSQSNQGTVEVCINTFWSSICTNSWDSRDAQVVCRQLGYATLGTQIKASTVGWVLIAWFNDCILDKSNQIMNPIIAKVNPVVYFVHVCESIIANVGIARNSQLIDTHN